MKRGLLPFVTLAVLWLMIGSAAAAVGFGASTVGGKGGRSLTVTRTDDNPASPQRGSLRWALLQRDARVISFKVDRPIVLRDRVVVRTGRVTVDGSLGGGNGVTIEGGSLDFAGTSEVIVRHVRVRLGEAPAKRSRSGLRGRPTSSNGLDCVNLRDCRNVLLEHVTMTECCDELLSVVRCQNVTVDRCLFAEPLGGKRLHPYGDDHRCCVNASASTLTLHRCVFTDYRYRGPQFEANDAGGFRGVVRMEVVGSVMARYDDSGSRFTAVPDKERRGKRYEFQFIGNHYLSDDAPALAITQRDKLSPVVKAAFADNFLERPRRAIQPDKLADKLENEPLFTTRGVKYGRSDAKDVVGNAGCLPHDATDSRLLSRVWKQRD